MGMLISPWRKIYFFTPSQLPSPRRTEACSSRSCTRGISEAIVDDALARGEHVVAREHTVWVGCHACKLSAS